MDKSTIPFSITCIQFILFIVRKTNKNDCFLNKSEEKSGSIALFLRQYYIKFKSV